MYVFLCELFREGGWLGYMNLKGNQTFKNKQTEHLYTCLSHVYYFMKHFKNIIYSQMNITIPSNKIMP